jgi:uncharacterized protein YkwD
VCKVRVIYTEIHRLPAGLNPNAMRAVLPLLACLFPLAAVSGTAQTDPRSELLRLLNAERQRVGAPPLRLLPALSRAAEEHAAEIAARGSRELRAGSTEAMRQRLERVGYEAHSWTERLVATPDDLPKLLRDWRQRDPESYRQILASEVRDLGIGLDRLQETPLYVFLFAVPQADHFERGTAGIRDLEKVRVEMLARVNDARRKAGVAPLKPNAALDRAAQRHAEDMLGRRYFAHESPEGKTVRERARAAGYNWRTIGENVAENQFSVDEVMDTWLRSPGHRRNILNPDFKELGIGLARGRSGSAYRVLWAQAFGAR